MTRVSSQSCVRTKSLVSRGVARDGKEREARSTPFEARLPLLVKGGGSFFDVFAIIRDHYGQRPIPKGISEFHRFVLVNHSLGHSYCDWRAVGECFGPVSGRQHKLIIWDDLGHQAQLFRLPRRV